MEENEQNDNKKSQQIGEKPVGIVGIIIIMIYLISFSIFLFYCFVQFFPSSFSSVGKDSISQVTFINFKILLPDEIRLLIIVALAGALGSLVHALRSFYKYVGNRELVWSWVAMYIMLPFVGSALALVFYFIMRGGFFSTDATVQQTSPFGFVALAALVGLFSEQAVGKLKEVAETLLIKTEKEKNPIRQNSETESVDETLRNE
ncbi:MAG: hypothetical protein E4G94_00650 [ANME-2 cluster archaeon]|nr:MAG: hypothetical protein E4G94_00650 [ANME-2 cluster archaeon]